MIEKLILSSLIVNEDFARKVLPYVSPEYFQVQSERITFEVIRNYIHQYNKPPTIEAIKVDLFNRGDLNEHLKTECQGIIKDFDFEAQDGEWLVNNTEKFCQDKAIENGLYKCIEILQDKEGKSNLDRGSIPKILSDALAVSFDTHIGHDFLDDWLTRYKFYHTHEARIPFDIELLNKITDGGLPRKTLNILMGGVGFGKTLMMCHMAASNLLIGKKVLYITLEMAEERIAERIDANLLDIPVNELKLMQETLYEKKVSRLREKTPGKLIIKEYPTAQAGADNFRHLLNELKLKKNFIPDIIYIDYLNICKSSRVKFSSSMNTYVYVKMIAEEIRGLAVEFNVPVVSATQLNREGFTNSDPGMEHTSDSFGLPATADMLLAMVSNEELIALNQLSIKQIKNRYGDLSTHTRFHVGCDRRKMRLYNIEESAQLPNSKIESTIFDKGQHAPFDRKAFEGFK